MGFGLGQMDGRGVGTSMEPLTPKQIGPAFLTIRSPNSPNSPTHSQDAGPAEDALEERVAPLQELAQQAARRPNVPADAHAPSRLERQGPAPEMDGAVDRGGPAAAFGGGRGGAGRVYGREVVLLLQHGGSDVVWGA